MSTTTNRRTAAAQRHLTIYDGRERRGAVVQIDGRFIVTDDNGAVLGTFQVLRDAMAAIERRAEELP